MPRPASRPNPAVWGLFPPPFAAHSPETPPFSPPRPAAFPEKPRRKSPSPRRSRPVFPVSARHCAPVAARNAPAVRRFPENPPTFAPDSPVYSAVCPHLARDPARFAPEGTPRTTEARPENAPPPGVPSPLGLPPRPALPLRRGEACTPQGGLNLWERFSGDRRPVAHEFSRNSSPGGLHKNRVTVNKLQGVGDRPYPAYASTLWQVGQLIPTEEHKMQAGFMLCGYFRLWWAIAHYKTIFRFGKIEIR